jgi:hypothetical protein
MEYVENNAVMRRILLWAYRFSTANAPASSIFASEVCDRLDQPSRYQYIFHHLSQNFISNNMEFPNTVKRTVNGVESLIYTTA